MNNTNHVITMETRSKINDVILFHNQEDFVKALREGAAEENGPGEELMEEE